MDRKLSLFITMSACFHAAVFVSGEPKQPPQMEIDRSPMSVAMVLVTPPPKVTQQPDKPVPAQPPPTVMQEPVREPEPEPDLKPLPQLKPQPKPVARLKPTPDDSKSTKPRPDEVAQLPVPPKDQVQPKLEPPAPAQPDQRGAKILLPPQPLPQNQPPDYPRRAIQRAIEGRVEMEIHVLPTGRVSQVFVTASSGYHILDDAAVQAARKWIYQPATQRGRPVAYTLTQMVTFKIKDTRR